MTMLSHSFFLSFFIFYFLFFKVKEACNEEEKEKRKDRRKKPNSSNHFESYTFLFIFCIKMGPFYHPIEGGSN